MTVLLGVSLLVALSIRFFTKEPLPKIEPVEKVEYTPTYEIPLNSKG